MRSNPFQRPKRHDGRQYTGSKSLSDLVRMERQLAVSCLFCRHFVRLDTAAIADLAQRLGEDFPTPDLHLKLKCSKCGSRRVDVKMSGESA